jgi:hypothetical protein
MSDERARELLRMAGSLKTERSTIEQHWQDISDVMRPQVHPFTGNAQEQQGKKRTSKMFDAVPPLALEKHGAVLEALLSPRNQMWSKLATTDEALQEDIEVKRYLDAVNKTLFRVRYRPASNLASQLAESYLNLGSFGTQVLYVGDDIGRSIVYRSCGLHRILIAEDQHGRANQVFRSYDFTADQAMRAFVLSKPNHMRDAAAKKLPQQLRTAYEQKLTKTFKFMHVVVPRDVIEDSRRDYLGMPHASLHIFEGDSTVIGEGGFRTMPYCVSRYTKNAEELYGRSPAMLVLPDTNMLNRMNKVGIKVAEKQADPPLMTIDDSLAPFNLTPGAMNYGTLDDRGEPTVKAFEHRGEVGITLEMMDQKRAVIREAFLLDVFQALIEAPRMNMMQIMEIVKDKAALLSPIMGRQQSELFGPMTERELDILTHAGMLPPMPDALIEAGGEVTIEYLSPMAIAQRAETGVGILRTWEAITPLLGSEEGKRAARVFNVEATFRELAEINNYPGKAMYSEDEIKAQEEADEQQAAMSQALEAAPVISQSLKSMAEAQAAVGPGGLSA